MDNYFTSLRLPTLLGVNNSQATHMLNKNRFRKCAIIGVKQLQKKRYVAALNSAYQAKKECWQRLVRKAAAWFTYLFLNLVNQENILKNSNPISSTVTTSKWVLSTEWTRTWRSIGIRMKKWWWFPFFWMLLFRVCGCCTVLTKMKAMSLCLF